MAKGGMTISDKRDVNRYAPPQGPKNMGATPENCGPSGTQGPKPCRSATSGSVGLGGDRPLPKGTQGRY